MDRTSQTQDYCFRADGVCFFDDRFLADFGCLELKVRKRRFPPEKELGCFIEDGLNESRGESILSVEEPSYQWRIRLEDPSYQWRICLTSGRSVLPVEDPSYQWKIRLTSEEFVFTVKDRDL
ncbi:hypothetical protein ACOMHN_011210 [Nucella lapillus]